MAKKSNNHSSLSVSNFRFPLFLLETIPLEFLSVFLSRWSEEKESEESPEDKWRTGGANDLSLAPSDSQRLLPELPQVCGL